MYCTVHILYDYNELHCSIEYTLNFNQQQGMQVTAASIGFCANHIALLSRLHRCIMNYIAVYTEYTLHFNQQQMMQVTNLNYTVNYKQIKLWI